MRETITARKLSLLWILYGDFDQAIHQVRWWEISRALGALGWEVTLMANCRQQGAGEIKTLALVRPRIPFLRYAAFQAGVVSHLVGAAGSADVVLFHQDSAPFAMAGCLLRAVLKRRRPKLVMDIRTVPMVRSTIRGRLWQIFYWVVHRLGRICADGQTAITNRMAEHVGIPRSQLLGVWPSGVTTEHFQTARSKRAWPGPEKGIVLVYIGTLVMDRNLGSLCRAVSECRQAGMNVSLRIVGDGPDRPVLKTLASEVGGGAVSVEQAVPHSEVPEILAGAHIGVLPFPDLPRYRVSSPIKLFEYMAAGLPVLCTRIACHTDVLADCDCVFWAEGSNVMALKHAIRQVGARSGELKDMGGRACQLASLWSWDASARKLDAALRKLAIPVKRVCEVELTRQEGRPGRSSDSPGRL